MNTRILGAMTAAALVVGSASAGGFTEIEPNDTFGTGQDLGSPFSDGAFKLIGELAASDVDFFRVDMVAGYFYTVSIFDFTPEDPFDNDSFLGIFSPDGTEFLTDDDGGPGLLSSASFFADETGSWGIGVTGFGDTGFDGSHDEQFAYSLVVSQTVPAPGILSAFLIAGAASRRRRRRH